MSKKTRFSIMFLMIFSFILTASIVFASAPGRESLSTGAKAAGYDQGRDIFSIAESVLNIVLGVVGFIFFGFVLYGGVRWMTSKGNDELKQKAKDALTNAVIGLAIVVASYAITNFVFTELSKITTENKEVDK